MAKTTTDTERRLWAAADDLLGIQNRNLRRTRDLLLPKLMSGELDVEHIDINIRDPEAAVAAISLTESS